MDKQCRSMIISSTMVICRLKYPEQMTATECRHAIHHMQVTQASNPCHNSRLAVVIVSFEIPDAAHLDDHLHR